MALEAISRRRGQVMSFSQINSSSRIPKHHSQGHLQFHSPSPTTTSLLTIHQLQLLYILSQRARIIAFNSTPAHAIYRTNFLHAWCSGLLLINNLMLCQIHCNKLIHLLFPNLHLHLAQRFAFLPVHNFNSPPKIHHHYRGRYNFGLSFQKGNTDISVIMRFLLKIHIFPMVPSSEHLHTFWRVPAQICYKGLRDEWHWDCPFFAWISIFSNGQLTFLEH